MNKTNQLVMVGNRYSNKYAQEEIPDPSIKDYTISSGQVQDIERSIEDLNHLYELMESGQMGEGDRSLIHWVVKRLDSILFSVKRQ